MSGLSRSARRAQEGFAARGFEARILELPDDAHSAVQAAAAIGCELAQIAKSLVFRLPDDAPLLVIASGANRVDESKVAELAGGSLAKADADFVRAHTGYAIGGVPPTGHPEPIPAFLDEDLLRFDEIWAAAGNPRAVFPIAPATLIELSGARVANVATRA